MQGSGLGVVCKGACPRAHSAPDQSQPSLCEVSVMHLSPDVRAVTVGQRIRRHAHLTSPQAAAQNCIVLACSPMQSLWHPPGLGMTHISACCDLGAGQHVWSHAQPSGWQRAAPHIRGGQHHLQPYAIYSHRSALETMFMGRDVGAGQRVRRGTQPLRARSVHRRQLWRPCCRNGCQLRHALLRLRHGQVLSCFSFPESSLTVGEQHLSSSPECWAVRSWPIACRSTAAAASRISKFE